MQVRLRHKRGSGAGAVTAALFLQEFLAPGRDGTAEASQPRWIHVDFSGWNDATEGERVKGGEAMGLRALFGLIEAVASESQREMLGPD